MEDNHNLTYSTFHPSRSICSLTSISYKYDKALQLAFILQRCMAYIQGNSRISGAGFAVREGCFSWTKRKLGGGWGWMAVGRPRPSFKKEKT